MYWWGTSVSILGNITIIIGEGGLVAVELGGDPALFIQQIAERLGEPIRPDSARTQGILAQIQAYLHGDIDRIEAPLDTRLLTPFQEEVLLGLRDIPRGCVMTYGEIARNLGRDGAARAVGRALGANPLPLVLPCHRVIASDGSLGGFSSPGGVQDKAMLLEMEGVDLKTLQKEVLD
ncbi:MAG: methylated-DNA--[protein]-cysteine S-methyltransferase [Anaerolineales bacterium]|nr:methylated-DNA--[protein]-cysteine S-methyltransferase [Anaerolineales bacterium]